MERILARTHGRTAAGDRPNTSFVMQRPTIDMD